MPSKLRDLIRTIRSCKTAAEEREVVTKECAVIRTSFRDGSTQRKHRNVAKLMFINMLGYPTAFGQLECIKLIAGMKFEEKRIGYLALTCLLDETTDVLMLATNSIKNDLNNSNQYIVGLALSALGNIASDEMCRGLSREVEKLLSSVNPYIKKKAAICAVRMITKAEEVREKFNLAISPLLDYGNQGILLSGCRLLEATLLLFPDQIPFFEHHVPALISSFKSVISNNSINAPEYEVSGVFDPFLQVLLLRLFRIFGLHSKTVDRDLDTVLAQVLTNTDHTKNVGCSVIYECIITVTQINCDEGLKSLAINSLGRFLQNKDKNIRYVALATLEQAARTDPEAVTKHRSVIIECLRDNDISLKKKALGVTFNLINEANIKTMVKELLNYLLVADSEFKTDLVAKICLAVDKFAPSNIWYFDTMTKVLCLAGNYVETEYRNDLINLILANQELHVYAVNKLYFSTRDNVGQYRLVEVALWTIGEFADLLVSQQNRGPNNEIIMITADDVLNLVEQISERYENGSDMSNYTGEDSQLVELERILVNCAVKLSSRLDSVQTRISAILSKYKNHQAIELQQRTCEYIEILKPQWDPKRIVILDRTPVSLKKNEENKAGKKETASETPLVEQNTTNPTKNVDNLMNLLDDYDSYDNKIVVTKNTVVPAKNDDDGFIGVADTSQKKKIFEDSLL